MRNETKPKLWITNPDKYWQPTPRGRANWASERFFSVSNACALATKFSNPFKSGGKKDLFKVKNITLFLHMPYKVYDLEYKQWVPYT